MADGRAVLLPLPCWLDQDLMRRIWTVCDRDPGPRKPDADWAEYVASLLDVAAPVESLNLADPEDDL